MTEPWRQKLRRGNWSNIGFEVFSVSKQVGRRVAVHELAQSDDPVTEDMGREPDRWRVEAYLIGDEFEGRKDALVRAVRRKFNDNIWPAPLLKLPWHDETFAHLISAEVKQSSAEMRIARMTLTFVEGGRFKSEGYEWKRAPQKKVDVRAGSVDDSAATELEDNLETEGVPEAVREAAEDETRSLGALIDSLDVFGGAEKEVAALRARITTLVESAADLVLAPANLAAELGEAVRGILTSARSFRGAFFAYKSLFGFAPTLEGGGGTTATAADSNAETVANMIRELAVAAAARAAVRVDWETEDEAIEQRDELLEEIDLVVANASAPVYLDLESLRGALVEGVPDPARNLPRLRTLELEQTIPALVLAWRLYGDPTRSDEIATRNRLPYPTFLPGGERIQVVTDGGT